MKICIISETIERKLSLAYLSDYTERTENNLRKLLLKFGNFNKYFTTLMKILNIKSRVTVPNEFIKDVYKYFDITFINFIRDNICI